MLLVIAIIFLVLALGSGLLRFLIKGVLAALLTALAPVLLIIFAVFLVLHLA